MTMKWSKVSNKLRKLIERSRGNVTAVGLGCLKLCHGWKKKKVHRGKKKYHIVQMVTRLAPDTETFGGCKSDGLCTS